MRWQTIEDLALVQLGSTEALEARLPAVTAKTELARLPDRFFLSTMTRRIFQAGMTHRVINERWPFFEEYFWGFEPEKLALLSEDQLERAMQETRLIRHFGKLRTIPVNASIMLDVSRQAGGFGRWLADWPDEDIVGLWRTLAKQFERLGGQSGPRFLRLAGRDTFFLNNDVVAALINLEIIPDKPSGRKAQEAVNRHFVDWMAESGRPMAHLSRILSLTVG
ncbi:DNA-3-methyladenine glycosylase I [Marinobacteraceae bacterium S3BR75-40.1]